MNDIERRQIIRTIFVIIMAIWGFFVSFFKDEEVVVADKKDEISPIWLVVIVVFIWLVNSKRD